MVGYIDLKQQETYEKLKNRGFDIVSDTDILLMLLLLIITIMVILKKHGLLLKKHGIPAGNKWYSQVPNVVTETDDGKVAIYWDKPIKTDRKVSYNRPDVVVIDREENTWYIVDFAIPMDHHVKEKEEEKIDKYMDLAAEVRRQFRVKTVILPIVLGALGTVPAKLSKSLEKLEIDDATGSLQTSVLISTTAILRRDLNL